MNLAEIFEEFMNVVQEDGKYTIGLINQEGTVLFCSQKSFIGQHMDLLKPGQHDFYYKINAKDKNFGYLWVSSEENSLKIVGSILSESLSTRIMYEMNEDLLKYHVTKEDELIRCLLDENNFDMDYVLSLTDSLKIDSSKTRAAIYVYNNKGFEINEILRIKVLHENNEEIFSLINNNVLLIFKNVPLKTTNSAVKVYINKYITGLQNLGLRDCFYIVGSLQNKLKNYSASYKNCIWIKKNIQLVRDTPAFFTEHWIEYFSSQISIEDIHHIFDYYRENSKAIDGDELILIADQLYLNDYSITQASEDLFLHKNTLIYKIKKYEEIFNINIRGSFEGKLLFYLIAKAFRKEKKQKQVGVKS